MTKKKISFDSVTSVVYPLLFGALIVFMWQDGILHKLLNTDEYIFAYPTRICMIIAYN